MRGDLRKILSVLVLSLVSASELTAFGALSEFLSPDGNTHRTSTVYATDVVTDPKWDTSTPISIQLCTGGGAYASAPINYLTTKNTEVLADLNSALSTWNAVSGGPAFATATEDGTCGPSLGASGATQDSSNEISFTNTLSPGVLAYTRLYYTLSAGVLSLVEADIEFNTNFDNRMGYNERWGTGDCNDCASSCPASCTTGSYKISFEGVLLHEVGHLLGLSHTTVTDDNSSDEITTLPTMFPSVDSYVLSREMESLETDDELSKKNLYLPAGFPDSATEGSISGTVYGPSAQALRGAHVFAFSLSTNRTIAGTFSGMSGTYATTSGNWEIKGIPLNEDFIVLVEPVDRPEVHAALAYDIYNLPLYFALDEDLLGYKSFAVEAYPDVDVTDVRYTSDTTTAPGIASAQTFRLTSSSPSATGIDFYVSPQYSAPNDAVSTEISFPEDSAITNANPLIVTITSPISLDILGEVEYSLTALKNGDTSNWTEGVPEVPLSGTSIELQIDPTEFDPRNGEYEVTFSFTDSKYGSFSETQTITVSNWNESPLGGTSDSGGGCGLCTVRTEAKPTYWWIIGFLITLVFVLRIGVSTTPHFAGKN